MIVSLKKVLALFLLLVISINSFAAIVSDNDGSAFITKSEYDSLKNDFQSQIDSYNSSIDAKIDNAIATYLAGIKISTSSEKNPIFLNVYGKNPVFHYSDNANRTYADTTNRIIWGSYNIAIKSYNLTQRDTVANGAFLMEYDWVFPSSKFKILHKLKWDNDKGEWLFSGVANDAVVNWKWVTHQNGYNMAPGANPFIHWAWAGTNNYTGVIPKTSSINMGTRGSSYNGWAESSNTSRSYDAVNTSTQPSWSTGSWSTGLACDAGKWTEIDESDWKNYIEHLWVNNDSGAIERKFDLTSDEIHYITVEVIKDLKATANTVNNDITADYSEPKYVSSVLTWKDVYAVAMHGWVGNGTYNVTSRRTRLYPSQVKYIIDAGLKEPIRQSLYDAPLFDRVDKDADSLQFEITLSQEDGYDGATLYFSKKTWANTNHKPADKDIVKLYKDNDTTAADSIALTKGVKTKVTIKDLKKDELLFFSLVPESGKKAKIGNFEKCFYNFK